MSLAHRVRILTAVLASLLFDGCELGIMPVASLSVTRDLMGSSFTSADGAVWFARFTASLMFGAAMGGIIFGAIGDRYGRTKALGLSVLFYSIFAAAGGFVDSLWQMLLLRFLVGLGVGGLWPNAVSLVSECWSWTSRPIVSGFMSASLNLGILALSQFVLYSPITEENWRWIFCFAGLPAALGIYCMLALPESPEWKAGKRSTVESNLHLLFGKDSRRQTLFAVLIGAIPLIGAWSASKWMIPWADSITSAVEPAYKASTQGWWALGAVLGSFSGAIIAHWLGRTLSYALMSGAAYLSTIAMFNLVAPLDRFFHPVVFAQGFLSTLLFGWLALYLPTFFTSSIRASGTGLAFNSGRFITAGGVLLAGQLFVLFGSSYPRIGSVCAIVYATGVLAIYVAPFADSQGTKSDASTRKEHSETTT